jgi:phosphatidylglycerophosphatase A
MKKMIIIISSFFYTGYFPKGSGTVATLAFLPFYYFLLRNAPVWAYVLVTVIVFLVGVWSSNYAVVIHNEKDPHKVVIDEVAGYLVTMMFIPYTGTRMIIGFFASRIFDIIKLFPARQAEALPAGTGIMVDDVIAGVQANLFMWILILFRLDLAVEQAIRHVFIH